jgi:tetratricopeptide (TPR) repeat protein
MSGAQEISDTSCSKVCETPAVLKGDEIIAMDSSTMKNEGAADEEVCASCGKTAVDDVKLKKCACNLVKYCNDNCQDNHRPMHQTECSKQQQLLAAKARHDNQLFTQNLETHVGDCPICALPIRLEHGKYVVNDCCSQMLCCGCDFHNQFREVKMGFENERKCLFCRQPVPSSKKEGLDHQKRRAEVDDPDALNQLGAKRYHKGDYRRAYKYWSKAATLGSVEAHYNLSLLYGAGQGVEKNATKEVHHLEVAAIAGHTIARHNLGCNEGRKGNMDRSKRHFIIGANLGDDHCLKAIQGYFKSGIVTKEEYAAALYAYQAAIDATKSPQREEAENNVVYQTQMGVNRGGRERENN